MKIELNTYSVSSSGKKIATYMLRIPRIILPEITRHRMFSFSVASSRAIPIDKMIENAEFIPKTWRKNTKGMSPKEYLDEESSKKAESLWVFSKELMVEIIKQFKDLGVAKEQANRLLEPFLYVDMIITSTEFDNFFELRCANEAQEEIREVAVEMKRLYDTKTPNELKDGEYHIPMFDPREEWFQDNYTIEQALDISAARCARVSYKTNYTDIAHSMEDNLNLAKRLKENKHFSPFEHQARATSDSSIRSGNLIGWEQWRHIMGS